MADFLSGRTLSQIQSAIDNVSLTPNTSVVDRSDTSTLTEFIQETAGGGGGGGGESWTLAHTWVGPLNSDSGGDAGEQDFYFDWSDHLDIRMNIQVQTNQRNIQYNLFFPYYFLNQINGNNDYPWVDGNSNMYFSVESSTEALLQMCIGKQSGEQGTVYWYVYTKPVS